MGGTGTSVVAPPLLWWQRRPQARRRKARSCPGAAPLWIRRRSCSSPGELPWSSCSCAKLLSYNPPSLPTPPPPMKPSILPLVVDCTIDSLRSPVWQKSGWVFQGVWFLVFSRQTHSAFMFWSNQNVFHQTKIFWSNPNVVINPKCCNQTKMLEKPNNFQHLKLRLLTFPWQMRSFIH